VNGQLYVPSKGRPLPIKEEADWYQIWSVYFEEKYQLLLPRIQPWFFSCPARSDCKIQVPCSVRLKFSNRSIYRLLYKLRQRNA